MKLFFDTEFTGLYKDTDLVSIGIISEDGKTFYAELNDFNRDKVDDWLQENVISELLYENHIEKWEEGIADRKVYGNKKEVMRALRDWLQQFNGDIQMISDVCHYDMVLFIDLFGGAFDLPKNISAQCHDINQDIAEHYGISEKEAFDKSREKIIDELTDVEIYEEKHNALYDAKVIKAIYDEIA